MGCNSHTKRHILKYSVLQPQFLNVKFCNRKNYVVQYQTDEASTSQSAIFAILDFRCYLKFMLKNNVHHSYFFPVSNVVY